LAKWDLPEPKKTVSRFRCQASHLFHGLTYPLQGTVGNHHVFPLIFPLQVPLQPPIGLVVQCTLSLEAV